MSEQNERIYVEKSDRVTKYENNLVTLTLSDGTVLEPLEPRRLFPVGLADRYITLLNEDNKEVAIIRDLGLIDRASAEVVTASLDDYYLVPHIVRVISTSDKYGTYHWVVETDRGIKAFDIRNRNSDIKVYADGRIRVRDSDDNRYIIDDYKSLDAHSKKLLIVNL